MTSAGWLVLGVAAIGVGLVLAQSSTDPPIVIDVSGSHYATRTGKNTIALAVDKGLPGALRKKISDAFMYALNTDDDTHIEQVIGDLNGGGFSVAAKSTADALAALKKADA